MATLSLAVDWVDYLTGDVDVESDTFAAAFSNTAPASESSDPTAAGNGLLTNVTQVAYTNYSDDLTTDRQLENVTHVNSSGTLTVSADDFIVTASGGSFGPFRYVYFYDDTVTGDPIIGYVDYGSNLTLADGETLTVDISSGALFTVG